MFRLAPLRLASSFGPALVLATLTLACDPKTSGTTEPESALPSTGASADPTSAPDGADASAGAAEGGETEAGGEGAPEAADDADAGAADAGADSDAGPDSSADEAGGDASKATTATTAELPPPLYKDVREGCGGAAGVGTPVKAFKLATPEGKSVSPSYYKGRVVLLNFWGTWCKPCLEELPEFSRLYRRYRKYGLTLVAVATDEDAAAVQALVDAKKISAKVGIGGEAVAGAYGDRSFPFTFVVDTKGVIQAAYDGYKAECIGALERDIRAQLEARNR